MNKPALGLAIVLALGIGIGTTGAIFRVLDAALIQDLPYPMADRMVSLSMRDLESGEGGGPVSPLDFADWRDSTSIFVAMTAVSAESIVLTELGHPMRLPAARTTADFFRVMAVRPSLGTPAEQAWAEGYPLVAVSNEFWRIHLGADPNAIGEPLVIDGEPYEIMAVMPSSLSLPKEAEIWLPLPKEAGAEVRDGRFVSVFARLKEDTSVTEATVEMNAIAGRLADEYPETNAGLGIAVDPIREVLVGDTGLRLGLILGAAACVLLVICTNVASLLMSRATGRTKELNLRTALGARRRDLLRLLLSESLLLAGLGTLVGVALGTLGSRAFVALYPDEFTSLGNLGWSPTIIAFDVTLAIIATLLFVAGPAFQTLRADESKIRMRTVSVVRRGQGIALIAQVASTLMLLFGASLMLQSLYRLEQVDPGFRADNVILARVALPTARYGEPAARRAFFGQLIDQLRASPSIREVAGVTHPPLSGSNMRFRLTLPGGDAGEEPLFANYRAVTDGYFRTLGVPLVRGRDLAPADAVDAPEVAVVNQEFVRRYFGKRPAIGESLKLLFRSDPTREIVGVIGDIHHYGPDTPVQPEVYVPHTQHSWPFLTLAFEPRTTVTDALTSIRTVVAELDPEQPVDRIASLSTELNRATGEPRFQGSLLFGFALGALVVAMLGIYGVTAYWNTSRRPEIGVRLALGAERADIVRLLMRAPVGMIALGVAIGAAGSVGVARLLESRVFDIDPLNPLTFVTVAGLILSVATLTAYVPARLASHVDPRRLLRDD